MEKYQFWRKRDNLERATFRDLVVKKNKEELKIKSTSKTRKS